MDLQYSTSENYSSSFRDSPSNWSHKDGKGYVYKKSSYQYSSSGNKNTSSYMDKSAESNIDQLDELLEDLKNERKHTKDIDLVPSTNIYKTIERESTETPEPPKTTRMLKSSQYSETTKHVPIEYEKAVSPTYSSRAGTLRRDDYHMRDVNYGSSRNIVESSFESTLDSSVDSLAPKMKTSTTHLAKDLQNLTLTDDILPLPGTKVTTTVRTYTYEIPAETGGDTASSRSLVYKNNNNNYFNSMQHTDAAAAQSLPPRNAAPTLPPAIVYNTESYTTLKKNDEQQHHPHYVVHTKEIRDNMMTTNMNMSGRHEYAVPPLPLPLPQQLGGNSNAVKHQVIYKENTTENVQMLPEAAVYPRNAPPMQPSASSSSPLNYTPGPTINKYYYHESSSNVVNKVNEPMGNNNNNNNNNMAPPPKHPHGGVNGGGYPGPHAPMSSVVYKYSSTTSNTHQGPDYIGASGPLSQPAPFPVEGVNFSSTDGVPPQKVDELMQSFGNGDVTNKGDMEIMHRKREVETSVATPNSQKIPSINRAGKEVYYPPGHDMMIMQREEMASGSSAGGRWAKKSGMYEYESGYKSKSKTKTGGAVVPVCLPLCCAMPCSIM